jgi:predicted metal-dependent hydrolase
VLDLKYEARDVPQRMTNPAAIDAWFEKKTKNLNNFQKAVLRKRWANMEELLSATERKRRIVAKIVQDFDLKPRLSDDRGTAILVVDCHNWHLKLLHAAVPPLIRKWEGRLGVEVQGYFLQRMKTKWGSCNAEQRTIRLNTELVKKPRDFLEYGVVHEMIHILAPTHSPRFFDLLSTHYPSWSEARTELNELPIPAL